eukprot:CAMPEP_0174283336 /NCGR_PEP_ID=MMETSP0809-20121228/4012_1 /TAXON_ID=73025 ORGANISM="Eutreptiella gymnastica-like, Strain CCMP1594" /NCGR_SAMPLE_ID=MMETSP0809 /ASSEMBLY_ACC=CAM_ASM_000658 /LENGTH=139 /DNA_ID=CAMNT_0015378197 /DNA_START=45 /DNA_END=462 /DNA_ORIENTATION=-
MRKSLIFSGNQVKYIWLSVVSILSSLPFGTVQEAPSGQSPVHRELYNLVGSPTWYTAACISQSLLALHGPLVMGAACDENSSQPSPRWDPSKVEMANGYTGVIRQQQQDIVALGRHHKNYGAIAMRPLEAPQNVHQSYG